MWVIESLLRGLLKGEPSEAGERDVQFDSLPRRHTEQGSLTGVVSIRGQPSCAGHMASAQCPPLIRGIAGQLR